MAIEFYTGRPEFETTHEMATRALLIELLRKKFAKAERLVAAVFDFSCGKDIDLAIFKHNAVIAVELKECKSAIKGGENGEWQIMKNNVPAGVLKGGCHGNPFLQAKAYRFALVDYLGRKSHDFLPAQKADQSNFTHVSSIVSISPDIHTDSDLDFDFGRLTWFHVRSLPKLPDLLEEIRSSQFNFTDGEIRKLVRDVLKCMPLDTLPEKQPVDVGEVAQTIKEIPSLSSGSYDISWRIEPGTLNPNADAQLPDYIKDLNSEQKEAIEHRGSHLLILAGAGTGKTRTLTYRAVNLLGGLELTQKLLLMTFTNKAANEMRQRIRRVTKGKLSQMWLGTFHSICRRILVEHSSKIGYPKKFVILDEKERLTLMNRCRPRNAHINIKTSDILQLHSYACNAMKQIPEILQHPRFKDMKVTCTIIAQMIDSYQKRLKSSGRMDFDDLLTITANLLKNHPDVRREYQQRFKYILVDEYQDTCCIQAEILKLLSSEDNVTVVGDDSQAIYGFRAADVNNFLGFDKQFQRATFLKLEENYRSTPQILALANNNISHNKNRNEKNLFTRRSEVFGELPWACSCKDQNMEASFIVSRILELRRQGLELKTMAVLFRAGYQCAKLELALPQAKIPYRVVGANPFFENEHVQQILSWLCLVINPNDAISLSRVHAQQQGLTADLFNFIEEQSDQREILFWDSANLYINSPQCDSNSKRALTELRKKISTLSETYEKDSSIPVLIQLLLDQHYRDYLQTRYPGKLEILTDDVKALQDLSFHYSSIEDLIEQITLDQLEVRRRSQTDNFAYDDILTLSTIHASKGLEWNTVFIIGLAGGWFPHYKALDIEEERRMFHVALTRARQYLHLTHPSMVTQLDGSQRIVSASPFITELSESLYKKMDIK